MPISDAELDALWRRRRDPGSVGRAARDRLVEHYLPLVRREVDRYAAGLPRFVDRDEFLSDGMFGLIDAVDRFDETRGARFATFAEKRVRGAIIDGERGRDRAGWRFRDEADRVTAATSNLAARLGRSPSEDEIADELGCSVDHLRRVLVRVVAAARPTSGDDVVFNRVAGDSATDAGVGGGWAEDLRAAVATALAELDDRSRTILALYYVARRGCEDHGDAHDPACDACRDVEDRGLTLAEVGGLLGMSVAWASSMHTAALRAFREALTAHREPESAGPEVR